MTNWYTADFHFNHDNIIRFCNRPFASTAEMDGHYVSCLQACVAPEDDLWILGDFGWGKEKRDGTYLKGLFDQIPGRKHLIRGNHDKPWMERWGWVSVHDLYEVKDGNQQIVLCHYPLRSWRGMCRGIWHFFGHVHTEYARHGNSWNVGVDWKDTPFKVKGFSDV